MFLKSFWRIDYTNFVEILDGRVEGFAEGVTVELRISFPRYMASFATKKAEWYWGLPINNNIIMI
jgi:hypothetical protein